jgi:hypothetical protein
MVQPQNQPLVTVRFMKDDDMKDVREKFFDGHGPTPLGPVDTHVERSGASKKPALKGENLLHRIDQRLRRLLVRACHNSYAAAKVVQLFEKFLLASFGKEQETLDNDWWNNLLLECPTITHRKDNNRCTAQFFFHATLPTGGFHRLLLHAVCQFHGLKVVSRMETNFVIENQVATARALVVTGNLDDTSIDKHLLHHLGELVDDPICFKAEATGSHAQGLQV